MQQLADARPATRQPGRRHRVRRSLREEAHQPRRARRDDLPRRRHQRAEGPARPSRSRHGHRSQARSRPRRSRLDPRAERYPPHRRQLHRRQHLRQDPRHVRRPRPRHHRSRPLDPGRDPRPRRHARRRRHLPRHGRPRQGQGHRAVPQDEGARSAARQELPRLARRPRRADQAGRHEGPQPHPQGRRAGFSRSPRRLASSACPPRRFASASSTPASAPSPSPTSCSPLLRTRSSSASTSGPTARPPRSPSAKTSRSACTPSSTSCRTRSPRRCTACSSRSSRRTTPAAPRSSTSSRSPRSARSPAAVVTDGLIRRDQQVRLLREGDEVWKGKIASLKRFKDDVCEVRQGVECGIDLAGFKDIQVGDIIESFTTETLAAELGQNSAAARKAEKAEKEREAAAAAAATAENSSQRLIKFNHHQYKKAGSNPGLFLLSALSSVTVLIESGNNFTVTVFPPARNLHICSAAPRSATEHTSVPSGFTNPSASSHVPVVSTLFAPTSTKWLRCFIR